VNNIRLSVIVPFYNSVLYIDRCLKSLDEAIKSREDVETIFVNDGSFDGSYQKCLSFCEQHEQFRMCNHHSNRGVSAARNTGLSVAEGEWVTFLDADDTMTSDGVDLIVDAIQNYSRFNLIEFNHYRYYVEIGKRKCKYKQDEDEYNCIKCFEELNQYSPVWNKVYRKSIIDANNIRFNESLSFGEDLQFNLQYISKSPIMYHVAKSAIVRYFDNKKSLARAADRESVLKLTKVLNDMISDSDNKEFQNLVGRVILKEWSSPKYRYIFTGSSQNESK